jgi:hypothetical protein
MKNLNLIPKSRLGRVSMILLLGAFTIVGCEKVKYDDANGVVVEECETIGALTVVQNSAFVWEVQNNGQTLYHFPNELEANQTKVILDYYQVAEACDCGTEVYTNPDGEENGSGRVMMYQKTADGFGIGDEEINSYGNGIEDCLPFNPEKLVAKKVGENWTIVEQPGHLMFTFGDNKQACIDALTVIKKYGYNQTCYVGRAMASFNYLKRHNPSIQPIPSLAPNEGFKQIAGDL